MSDEHAPTSESMRKRVLEHHLRETQTQHDTVYTEEQCPEVYYILSNNTPVRCYLTTGHGGNHHAWHLAAGGEISWMRTPVQRGIHHPRCTGEHEFGRCSVPDTAS